MLKRRTQSICTIRSEWLDGLPCPCGARVLVAMHRATRESLAIDSMDSAT